MRPVVARGLQRARGRCNRGATGAAAAWDGTRRTSGQERAKMIHRSTGPVGPHGGEDWPDDLWPPDEDPGQRDPAGDGADRRDPANGGAGGRVSDGGGAGGRVSDGRGAGAGGTPPLPPGWPGGP